MGSHAPLSKEHREKLQKSKLGERNPMYGKSFSNAHKEAMSESAKKVIKSPQHRKNLGKARKKFLSSLTYDERNAFFSIRLQGKKITSNESQLNKFLQCEFPGEWKFVGNGLFMIEGRCPDFVNINGKKLLIEFHTGGPNSTCGKVAKSKVSLFEKYGYGTIVIRKSELSNVIILKEKMMNYLL